MGQVQIAGSIKNNTYRWMQTLTNITLCYSIAKYILQVPLTFSKLKTKCESFNIVQENITRKFQFCSPLFFFLTFIVTHNSKTTYTPNDCFAIYLPFFWLRWSTSYDWQTTTTKRSSGTQKNLLLTLLWLMFMYSGCGTYNQAMSGLLMCVATLVMYRNVSWVKGQTLTQCLWLAWTNNSYAWRPGATLHGSTLP